MRLYLDTNDMGIGIVTVSERHLEKLSSLPMSETHKDPNDRLIITQAITDKTPLVSSDRKFAIYQKYGLELIFNKK